MNSHEDTKDGTRADCFVPHEKWGLAMTNPSAIVFFIAGIILFLFSCSGSRHISIIGRRSMDTGSAASVNSKLQDNIFKFEWLSCKAKVRLIDKNGSSDVNASIRIRRDSCIWISVGLLGFEGLRVLITQDSIRVIDRQNKTYNVYDYSIFNKYTSLPITYKTVQNIIAGVPVYFEEKKLKVKKEDTTYTLLSNGKKRSSTIAISRDYTMLNMNLVDSAVGKSLKLKYKNYDRQNAKPFALDRELDLNDSTNTRVLIYFSKVVINQPLKFPFSNKYD